MNKAALKQKWQRIHADFLQKYENYFPKETPDSFQDLETFLNIFEQKSNRTRQDIETEIKEWQENDNHL